ncbi:NRDE family protein [bacterium]|nr:NRDE family protein [Verrucomicrobiales bacterium]MDC3255732.1 NRDE family protein [bacterium]
MCTLTWKHEADGAYHVFFNRDEKKTRLPELSPTVMEENGVRLIAPRDADHGGTWLAVNDRGVTFALLNHYDLAAIRPSPEHPMSRGRLPFQLASEECVSLESMNLDRYRPFHLVCVAPEEVPRHWIWNGASLQAFRLRDKDRPLTTSSYDSGRAVSLRAQAFKGLGSDPDTKALSAFHRSGSVHGSPYAVLMRRDDAQTMSISHICVTAGEVVVNYEPQAREFADMLETTCTRMPRAS